MAAAGLGPLLTASAPLLFALKIAGAVVLFALAYGAAKSALAAPSPAADQVKPRGAFNWFLRGAALNGLNPKALVAWGAVFLFGADPGGGVWAIWAACASLGLAIYVGYSLLFSLPPMQDAYAKTRRIADGIVAAVFGAAALRLLFWRVDAP